jgi:hypothetical protein
MDIILAVFSSAALLARTIIVITITGDDDPKTRRPPGLAPGGFLSAQASCRFDRID